MSKNRNVFQGEQIGRYLWSLSAWITWKTRYSEFTLWNE